MSKTSRTPYKKNNEKETCERCGKKKRNKCQMQPRLTVWITASKQFRLESSLECLQRWRRCDSGRQTVPPMGQPNPWTTLEPTVQRGCVAVAEAGGCILFRCSHRDDTLSPGTCWLASVCICLGSAFCLSVCLCVFDND